MKRTSGFSGFEFTVLRYISITSSVLPDFKYSFVNVALIVLEDGSYF